MQEKEVKKEAFRKYLESSGVVDALTKGFLLYSLGLFSTHDELELLFLIYASLVVLVALYEENDKPSSALE